MVNSASKYLLARCNNSGETEEVLSFTLGSVAELSESASDFPSSSLISNPPAFFPAMTRGSKFEGGG